MASSAADRAGVSVLEGVCDDVTARLDAVLRALEGGSAS